MSSNKPISANHTTGLEIAVIGMAGRFPGASNIYEFWKNLREGVESVSFFSDEELTANGIKTELLQNPNYVKANGVLQKAAYFDASFFGYVPKEAETMDPQTRVLHEIAWEALEDAGYDPFTYPGKIGIAAGSSTNLFWEALSYKSGNQGWADLHLSNRNFLTTFVSYKLNLKGPSFYIQTACSTSLVAIHHACRTLLTGEAKMMLAGGVTIALPQQKGYLYAPGMHQSPEGRCRAFDANAKGIVGGSGAGLVVLKRLKDAIQDRDAIYAVIKGSAINNDGSEKIGFSAPSVTGQKAVIRAAHRMAKTAPESIGYVETHGTGTELGDPIEFAALTEAFNTDKQGFCPIGSVKTNVGHLDSAAGVTGFIKTVLALKENVIPPSLHFENPNPRIDFENSPFYVNTQLSPFREFGHLPRAGVSSFGIGGTNAHLVLEAAEKKVSASPPHSWKLLPLSAKSSSALKTLAGNLATYLNTHQEVPLDDIAYTLQQGRKPFNFRTTVVCKDHAEAIQKLEAIDGDNSSSLSPAEEEKSIVFMFSGLGTQYQNIARDLYQEIPAFRERVDTCLGMLETQTGTNIRSILYPDTPPDTTPDRTDEMQYAQPVKFIVEYALAHQLMDWGIQPDALIGHSFGEYIAACLAGVFSLEDALKIVTIRGKLMEKMEAGSMLSVDLSEEELSSYLGEELSLALVNGPSLCVVSGSPEKIAQLEKEWTEKGQQCILLNVQKASHSFMVDPILDEFKASFQHIQLHPPKQPYVSGTTGTWITHQQATDPQYWVNNLRDTVRFKEGLTTLLEKEQVLFLEVGAGTGLIHSLNIHPQKGRRHSALNLIRKRKDSGSDYRYFLEKIGKLWQQGFAINWLQVYPLNKRHRAHLPTYPFEGEHFFIDGSPFEQGSQPSAPAEITKLPMQDWFYLPTWEQAPHTTAPHHEMNLPDDKWLVLMDPQRLGQSIIERLEKEGQHNLVWVEIGNSFQQLGPKHFQLNPASAQDYHSLFVQLQENELVPTRILHLWTLEADLPAVSPLERIEADTDRGYFSLLHLAKTIGDLGITTPVKIVTVTHHLHDVLGTESLDVGKSPLLGAAKIIPMEYANISCTAVDLDLVHSSIPPNWVEYLIREFKETELQPVVAYRGQYRWIQNFKPTSLAKPKGITHRLKKEGVYLITGGFGGMGSTVSEYLAATLKARLVLTTRSPFPKRAEWEQWIKDHSPDDPTTQRIQLVKTIEQKGGQVLVCQADVASLEEMQEVIQAAETQFGNINGVFHTAGLGDYAGVIQFRTREMSEKILAPKVRGTLVLDSLLAQKPLDFMVLFSSTGTVLFPNKIGQVAYCAANDFLDNFSYRKQRTGGPFTVTINWSDWRKVGMAIEAINHRLANQNAPIDYDKILAEGLTPIEGLEVLNTIMDHAYPRIVVLTRDLELLKAQYTLRKSEYIEASTREVEGPRLYARPELSSKYVEADNELEKQFVTILQEILGIKEIGINDNFFDMGANSVHIIHANNKLKKLLGKEIAVVTWYEHPTIKAIAGSLQETEVGVPNQPQEPVREKAMEKGKMRMRRMKKKKKGGQNG